MGDCLAIPNAQVLIELPENDSVYKNECLGHRALIVSYIDLLRDQFLFDKQIPGHPEPLRDAPLSHEEW